MLSGGLIVSYLRLMSAATASQQLVPGDQRLTAAARAMAAIVLGRPEWEQRVFLDTLSFRLGAAGFDPAHEVCANALRACHDETGKSSRMGYKDWRRSQDDPRGWPSANTIKERFGSWEQARAAIGQALHARPSAHRLWARPDASDEQLLEAVKLYAAISTGPMLQRPFMQWCATAEAEETVGCVLPRSITSITSRIGRWSEVLVSAGLSNRRYGAKRTARGRKIIPSCPDLSLLPENQAVYTEGYLQALAEALCDLLGRETFRRMTIPEYGRLRADLTDLAASRQDVLNLPSVATIGNRPGAFAAFKAGAGFACVETEPADRAYGPPVVTRKALVEAVQRACEELGTDFSRREYDAWRAAHPHGSQALPCSSSILKRLGGKPSTMQNAREAAKAAEHD